MTGARWRCLKASNERSVMPCEYDETARAGTSCQTRGGRLFQARWRSWIRRVTRFLLKSTSSLSSAISKRASSPVRLRPMVTESPLQSTEQGLVPTGDGWFVLNATEARWYYGDGRSAVCVFEGEGDGETEFDQLGINLSVLEPGVPMAMYHWEADQEDFLVLAGEAVLVVEGEERPLRQWDFVHCPPETKHVIVGAGAGPCVVLAVGARDKSTGSQPGWGGYAVDA